MMHCSDTIAAVATPPGQGGIGVVRVSGPEVAGIARALLGRLPPPRQAQYLPFRDAAGEAIDAGIALYFAAPHSFTGEEVLELQGHGGPVVMDMLLRRVLELGARAARPGEFSERAFLNGKMDLAQAEAVADLIASATEQAARSAQHSLQGDFSRRIHALVEALTGLRVYVESAIDFPEEEIDFLADGEVSRRLRAITAPLEEVLALANQGQLLREGMRVVIAGRPNAGKSSLLNRLARRAVAIVTPVPGTTRDVLREQVTIDDLPLHIMDTAGLRECPDPIEREGIQRAGAAMADADHILLIVDDSEDPQGAIQEFVDRYPPQVAFTVVRNKIDLSGQRPAVREGRFGPEVLLCAKTGEGIDLLCHRLKESAGYTGGGEGGFMARRRHLEALRQAQASLNSARHQLEDNHAGELLAEELRQAQNSLAAITGEVTSEDLLERIFSSFCIGK